MKHLTILTLAFGCLLSSSGCAAQNNSEVNRDGNDTSSQSPTVASSQHFKNQLQDAKQYGYLIKSGLSLREKGQLEEALISFKKALNDHATMRNEQATASDQVAITLEQMGKADEAAKYYDLASELTMNENRRVLLAEKAKKLRNKQSLTPHRS